MARNCKSWTPLQSPPKGPYLKFGLMYTRVLLGDPILVSGFGMFVDFAEKMHFQRRSVVASICGKDDDVRHTNFPDWPCDMEVHTNILGRNSFFAATCMGVAFSGYSPNFGGYAWLSWIECECHGSNHIRKLQWEQAKGGL